MKRQKNQKEKQLDMTKFVLKRTLLFLIDFIICVAAGVLAGIFSSVGKGIFYSVETVTYATLIGVVIQTFCMGILGGYKFVVKYSDIYYNARLIAIFFVSFIAELLIVGGVFGFRDGTVFSFLQVTLTFTAIVVSRFVYQYYVGVQGKNVLKKSVGTRVMIIGAGWTGRRVLTDLTREKEKYTPVCIIDDDPTKQKMVMEKVPIVGGSETIRENAVKYGAEKIVFAIPSAPTEVRNEIISECLATGLEVNILPCIGDLVAKADFLSLMRKVKLEDLLEREPVTFDVAELNDFINGKVCLVTGGGGSIGSELCRHIASYKPSKLIIADVYENSTFDINFELVDKFGGELDIQTEIVSVTDEEAMDKLIREERVQLIFHAAAHKHVPLMEHNPAEAIKNNVVGTWTIAKLAAKYKVEKVVMVSTDKAVNPTNVMGATKRFCEKIVEYWGTQTEDTKYSVTRFGNVLGSNGSVVHIFNKQIASGGPVKVTHPDIIRYFMTISEAVSLILQSSAFAKGGEVFVLDMGEPVKIVKLAENMIRLAGLRPYQDVKIDFTGLRPGEKLYEELLMSEEGLTRTPNKKIYIGNQSYIADPDLPRKYGELVSAAYTNDNEMVITALCAAVETYTPDARFHKWANDLCQTPNDAKSEKADKKARKAAKSASKANKKSKDCPLKNAAVSSTNEKSAEVQQSPDEKSEAQLSPDEKFAEAVTSPDKNKAEAAAGKTETRIEAAVE